VIIEGFKNEARDKRKCSNKSKVKIDIDLGQKEIHNGKGRMSNDNVCFKKKNMIVDEVLDYKTHEP